MAKQRFNLLTRRARRGAVLVELLIGLAIGALVITAAVSALLMLRHAQGTVDDQSQLQQRASFLVRLLGRQIRAAGSHELDAAGDALRPGFRFVQLDAASAPDGVPVVQGTAGRQHDSLTLTDAAPPSAATTRRDCLGQSLRPDRRTSATFHADATGKLSCRSSSGQNQPLAYGVNAFRVRYRVSDGALVRELGAEAVQLESRWAQVNAVEICLDLTGELRADGISQRYEDCSGRSATDRERRHLVIRRLFQVRIRQAG